MADIVLPATILNGPAEVGLAAAAGDNHDSRYALPVGGRTDHAINQLAVPRSGNPIMRRLYYIAAVITRERGWYLPLGHTPGNVIANANGAIEGDRVAMVAGILMSIGAATASDVGLAVFLLMATKVCMWMFNHHVGQGTAVGFAAKAIRFVLGMAQDAPIDQNVVGDVWVMGHWVNTGSAWFSMGVIDLRPQYAYRGCFAPAVDAANINHPMEFPMPTRDILQRITAGPAGTGKATACKAIVKRAVSNAYSVLLPPSATYVELLMLPDQLVSARNHVGSVHFTGQVMVVLYDVPSEDAVVLAGFAHAALSGSSLARAPSLPSEAEAKSTDVFASIQRAKMAMIAAPADARTIAHIGVLLGRGEGGDPFTAARDLLQLPPRPMPAALPMVAAAAGAAVAAGPPAAGFAPAAAAP